MGPVRGFPWSSVGGRGNCHGLEWKSDATHPHCHGTRQYLRPPVDMTIRERLPRLPLATRVLHDGVFCNVLDKYVLCNDEAPPL